jgi:hypothetical protein
MTAGAQTILDAFDALPPHEQTEVAAEILRRTARQTEQKETAASRDHWQRRAREFRPIKVSGPPLSEDIIRDRRARD